MDKNPHSLEASGNQEILSLLLTRFFEWKIWSHEHQTHRRNEGCNKELWNNNTCCEQHKNYQAEWKAFFAAIRTFSSPAYFPGDTYSPVSMKEFISEFNLTVDTIVTVLALGISEEEWSEIKT